MQNERYKSIPTEVARYVQGHYGMPEAPIAPELLERVQPRPASSDGDEDPVYQARKKYGESLSDDDLLLHMLFREEQLADIQFDAPARKRISTGKSASDLVGLIKT